jgi:hypothetical protein
MAAQTLEQYRKECHSYILKIMYINFLISWFRASNHSDNKHKLVCQLVAHWTGILLIISISYFYTTPNAMPEPEPLPQQKVIHEGHLSPT